MSERIIEKHLHSIYYDLKNPESLGSIENLFRKAKITYPQITREFVKNWLSSQKTYTLHKERRRYFKRNKFITKYPDQLWQIDLAEAQDIEKQNSGYRYLFTIIDCFSKFAYVIPLKNKSGKTVVESLEKLLKNKSPKNIQSDKGKEFQNNEFKTLMKKYKINYYVTENDDIKCSIVERFNRTIKQKIYKFMTFKNTKRYIDILPDLVFSYNNKIHRSTGFKPSDINIDNQKIVFKNLYGKSYREILKKRSKPKLKKGHKVRISKHQDKFTRSYKPGWSDEIFTITKDFDKERPVYKIRDEKEEIEGKFYDKEVQKVSPNLGNKYHIEKILESRKIGKNFEYYVKFKNQPEFKNTWVRGRDLADLQ